MDAMSTMRDLDQIRERDDRVDSSRLALIALGGLATACLLFAIGIWIGRDGDAPRATAHEDPLARLDALAGQPAAPPEATPVVAAPEPVAAAAVTPSPATNAPAATPLGAEPVVHRTPALSAAPPPAAAFVAPTGGIRVSEPAPARLPVAPANSIRLSATSSSDATTPAAPGTDGAFTLQVSSFRTNVAAESFAQRLRDRGYRAFVTTATGTGGIVWHRVRIGPFATLREAAHYRAEFESRERLPTFVVRRDEPLPHGG